MVAVIGVGLVTIVPSAGAGAVIVGGGRFGFGPGTVQVTVVVFETVSRPDMLAVAVTRSVPAAELTYEIRASPAASVETVCCSELTPETLTVTGTPATGAPMPSIALTVRLTPCPTVAPMEGGWITRVVAGGSGRVISAGPSTTVTSRAVESQKKSPLAPASTTKYRLCPLVTLI